VTTYVQTSAPSKAVVPKTVVGKPASKREAKPKRAMPMASAYAPPPTTTVRRTKTRKMASSSIPRTQHK